MQRTPYLARKQGSALLSRVARWSRARGRWASASPDPAVRDAKFVAYVGHDTNIWNLAGMLDVTWLQPGYQRNQTPPAGALMFEVRESADKKLRVYTSYVAQSLEQMRNATPLTAGGAAGEDAVAAARLQHQRAGGISVHAGGIRGRGAQRRSTATASNEHGQEALRDGLTETKMAPARRARRARERARHQHAADARHESRGGDHARARRRGEALGGHRRDPSEGEDRCASSRRRSRA